MKIQFHKLFAAAISLFGVLFTLVPAAWADDLKGVIQSVNSSNQSFVVEGITLWVTPSTEYTDGLQNFSSLKPGQRVEVDVVIRNGKHYVKEVDLD